MRAIFAAVDTWHHHWRAYAEWSPAGRTGRKEVSQVTGAGKVSGRRGRERARHGRGLVRARAGRAPSGEARLERPAHRDVGGRAAETRASGRRLPRWKATRHASKRPETEGDYPVASFAICDPRMNYCLQLHVPNTEHRPKPPSCLQRGRTDHCESDGVWVVWGLSSACFRVQE